jgi:hypothetical protein
MGLFDGVDLSRRRMKRLVNPDGTESIVPMEERPALPADSEARIAAVHQAAGQSPLMPGMNALAPLPPAITAAPVMQANQEARQAGLQPLQDAAANARDQADIGIARIGVEEKQNEIRHAQEAATLADQATYGTTDASAIAAAKRREANALPGGAAAGGELAGLKIAPGRGAYAGMGPAALPEPALPPPLMEGQYRNPDTGQPVTPMSSNTATLLRHEAERAAVTSATGGGTLMVGQGADRHARSVGPGAGHFERKPGTQEAVFVPAGPDAPTQIRQNEIRGRALASESPLMREAAARRMEGAAATGAEAEAALAGHTATIQGKIAALPITEIIKLTSTGQVTPLQASLAVSQIANETRKTNPEEAARLDETARNLRNETLQETPGRMISGAKAVAGGWGALFGIPGALEWGKQGAQDFLNGPGQRIVPIQQQGVPVLMGGAPAALAAPRPPVAARGPAAPAPARPTPSPVMPSVGPGTIPGAFGGMPSIPAARPATGVSVGGGRFRTDEERAVAGTMISKTPDERLATLAVRYPKDPLLLAEVRRRRGGGGGGRPAPQMAASPLFA